MIRHFFKAVAPVAMVAVIAALGGCDLAKVSINGEEGKKLADLDLTAETPHDLVLLGPDTVRITRGDKLAIAIEGDSAVAENLRFTLKDGTLGILRKDKPWSGDNGKVTVNVTMPDPVGLTMAGSGVIESQALSSADAKINIVGSGSVATPVVAAESLKVNIAGSGSYRAAGTAKNLKLTIAGSGDARLDALKVEDAKVDVAGSGDSTFASDGSVKANIMGSGQVRVLGRATCKVSSMGSGRLVCEPGPDTEGTAKPAGQPAA